VAIDIAYLHRHHYARLANKPYNSIATALSDNEVVLTVNAYNDDDEIAAKQRRIFRVDLQNQLMSENPNLSYDDMIGTMVTMASELFRGAAKFIGSWPSSSAYYAVDVIFDTENALKSDGKFIPQAKLLEVNFMGDMEAARLGSPTVEEYDEWVNDLITCLAMKQPVDPTRHTRL
jgi:hypothetical protein